MQWTSRQRRKHERLLGLVRSMVRGLGWRGGLVCLSRKRGRGQADTYQQERESNRSAFAQHELTHSRERLRISSLADFTIADRTSKRLISCAVITEGRLPAEVEGLPVAGLGDLWLEERVKCQRRAFS